VETEANVLVALLAIRTLGGRSAPISHPVVKALKGPIKEATDRGLLHEETRIEQVPVEGKKPKRVTTKLLGLTPAGEGLLRESAHPEALAATHGRIVAAELESLRRTLDADRDALKQQVQAALSAKGKDKEAASFDKDMGKLSKEVEKLAKSLATVTEQVRQLEARQPQGGGGPGALMAKIDEGFAALRAKLDQALDGLPKPTAATSHPPPPPTPHPAPAPTPPAPPPPAPAAPIAPETLQTVLHKAYEELRSHYREYQEGMVDLPRLYHEAKRSRSDLSVADFHKEVLALEGKRILDLHIRNEVRDAPEPDKAIHRNNKLYYFVYWPRS